MKKEHIEYLKTIGLSDILIERVDSIYSLYKEVCPEEITDIFVDNYLKKDGTNVYESLWFFSGNSHVMEARQFAIVEEDIFDILSIPDQIVYCKFEKRDYNFKKATDKSRLSLEIWFRDNEELLCIFTASEINCDFLKEIYMKIIKPKLKKTTS